MTKISKEKTSILFIGNSFTYYNDMPKMVQDIGVTNNINVHVENITYGGYSLNQYLEKETPENDRIISTLSNHIWDYVVLQEQSIKPYKDKKEFISSVKSLSKLIKENGAKVILYSTWSYRDGSDKLLSTKLTYKDMYNILTNTYNEAAKSVDSLIAPVGTAFYRLTMEHPEISILTDDDYHPNKKGKLYCCMCFL